MGGNKGGHQAWNYNPTGKGYQEICWKRGLVGHKSNECTTRINEEEKEGEEKEVFCGGRRDMEYVPGGESRDCSGKSIQGIRK